MNSLPLSAHWEGDSLFSWYDSEPSLRVAIITGSGTKAFCAGQDLASLLVSGSEESGGKGVIGGKGMPESGFAGLSRRKGKKPVLAAVNGFALGGGFEIVLNWLVWLSFLLCFSSSLVGLCVGFVGLLRILGCWDVLYVVGELVEEAYELEENEQHP